MRKHLVVDWRVMCIWLLKKADYNQEHPVQYIAPR
jgi:hypothetical protein